MYSVANALKPIVCSGTVSFAFPFTVSDDSDEDVLYSHPTGLEIDSPPCDELCSSFPSNKHEQQQTITLAMTPKHGSGTWPSWKDTK